jgi:hypothetical protein
VSKKPEVKEFNAMRTGQQKAETIHLLSPSGEVVTVGTHADLVYDEVHTVTEGVDGENVKRHTEIEQGEPYALATRFTSYGSSALSEVLLGSTDHLATALKAGWSVIDADKAQSIRDEAAKVKAAEDAKAQEERSVQAAKQAEEIAAQNKVDIELLTEAFSKTPKVLEIFTRRFGLIEQKQKIATLQKK